MHDITAEFKCTEAPLTSHTRLLSITETLLKKPPTTADESMFASVKLMMLVTADETAVGDISVTNGVADTSYLNCDPNATPFTTTSTDTAGAELSMAVGVAVPSVVGGVTHVS
jgi:hypothetical protein